MALTTQQKNEIIVAKLAVPTATNAEIAEAQGLTKSQVAGVLIAYKRFGGDYFAKLQSELGISETIHSDFNNFCGDGKLSARERILLAIKFAKYRCGKILTLPSSEWRMERIINNEVSKRFSYVACDNNPEYFKKMVAKSDWYGTNNVCHQTSVGNLILSAKEDEYSHLILDYCGRFETYKQEILHACSNNIVKKGGVIAVTLYRTRSNSPMVSKLNRMYSDVTGQFIRVNDNTNAVRMFFQCVSGVTDFEIVEEFTYSDKSPMILVILKRN